MKKIFSLLGLMMVLSTNSFAQEVHLPLSQMQEKYLKKSKNQKVGSVLLAVAGTTIGLVGGLVSAVSGGGNAGPDFPIVPVTVGVGCLAGSVALSKAAARNQQKALNISAQIGVINFLVLNPASKNSGTGFGFSLQMAWH